MAAPAQADSYNLHVEEPHGDPDLRSPTMMDRVSQVYCEHVLVGLQRAGDHGGGAEQVRLLPTSTSLTSMSTSASAPTFAQS
ncbi:hypothetical protein BDA96_01G285800 [Sorghum bicolor]|uniref:Uncharacterized protein n=1 Tax=Sorghum bicolor TaxID=4558 RepID=A0A921S1C6_SORBI|nr:hypothetical protein BDA96_01G285800 [Sorghum bicolor]